VTKLVASEREKLLSLTDELHRCVGGGGGVGVGVGLGAGVGVGACACVCDVREWMNVCGGGGRGGVECIGVRCTLPM